MKPLLGTLVLCATLAAAVLSGCGGGDAPTEQTIRFRHSRFVQDSVNVRAGVPVRITLRNTDPIEHEWIVGSDEVHDRHRKGTEPYHDEVPTEVTVPALSTRTTTLVFDQPGIYTFICHLPGHEAYGMKGTIKVVG